MDFSNLFAVIKNGNPPPPYPTVEAAQTAGAVTVNYGLFINHIITFLIVAFAVFLLVRAVNRLRRQQEAAPPAPPAAPPEEIVLLTQIRDALKR